MPPSAITSGFQCRRCRPAPLAFDPNTVEPVNRQSDFASGLGMSAAGFFRERHHVDRRVILHMSFRLHETHCATPRRLKHGGYPTDRRLDRANGRPTGNTVNVVGRLEGRRRLPTVPSGDSGKAGLTCRWTFPSLEPFWCSRSGLCRPATTRDSARWTEDRRSLSSDPVHLSGAERCRIPPLLALRFFLVALVIHVTWCSAQRTARTPPLPLFRDHRRTFFLSSSLFFSLLLLRPVRHLLLPLIVSSDAYPRFSHLPSVSLLAVPSLLFYACLPSSPRRLVLSSPPPTSLLLLLCSVALLLSRSGPAVRSLATT